MGRYYRRILGGSLLMLCLTAPYMSWAEAESVTNETTNVSFKVRQAFDNEEYVFVGTGIRKAGAIRVYTGGMYVGVDQAKVAWQRYLSGRFNTAGLVQGGLPNFEALRESGQLRHFMVYGRFPKSIEMVMMRDVRADQARVGFQGGLQTGGADPESIGEPYQKLVDAVARPLPEGEHLTIRSKGNTIWVTFQNAGTTTRIDANHALVTALWRIYFGEPCLQDRLRQGLFSHIQHLQAL